MRTTLRRFRTAHVLCLLSVAIAAPAVAEEEPTLTEIVNILREKGLLDEDQHADLAAKAAKEQDKQDWTDRVSVWGDFRARFEAFQFEQDVYSRSTGTRLHDRYRGRYRGRLNVSGKVASRATVYLGMASGGADPRSANQSLGSGLDFDKDEFRFDLAYATLSPFPDGELPGIENGYLAVDVGKVKNPFIWKQLGVDNLLFDNDINPEGANLRITGNAGPVLLFANGGVYVIDENSAAKDPLLSGGQLGASLEIADHISIGARGTLYHFFSLDSDFATRGAANPGGLGGTGGNILDGLSRRNGSIQVAETSAFLNIGVLELFPVLFYGSYARNLSARSSLVAPGVGREDDAWTVGVFVGDKATLVRLGFAYYYLEANALPSMFVESDVLDGTPNRHGYMASVERQLFENVDLVLKGFASDRIEGGVPFANSGPASDRLRGQADLVFKF